MYGVLHSDVSVSICHSVEDDLAALGVSVSRSPNSMTTFEHSSDKGMAILLVNPGKLSLLGSGFWRQSGRERYPALTSFVNEGMPFISVAEDKSRDTK